MDINEIKKIVEQIRAKYCRTDEMAKKPETGGTQMATPSGGSTGMATPATTHNYTQSNAAPKTPGGTGPKTPTGMKKSSNGAITSNRNNNGTTSTYDKYGRRTGSIKTVGGRRRTGARKYSQGATTHNYTNH